MKHLHVNPKLLTLFLLFLVLLPSCNNEEIFIVEESAIIAEETEPTAEDTPNNEDVAPPIDAVDDTVITMQNVPVDIAAYLNDTNLPQSITLSNTNPSNGVLTINNNDTPDNFIDDTVVYTPNAGFSGNDSFDYTICDATNPENCDTATVTITINPIEDDFATQLKAFPSAEGYGKNATGGRGGTVIKVTNLNADGAGSFKAACEASGTRIVVFEVGGRINLTNTINITNPNITIAGQTASGDGITISMEGTPNKPLMVIATNDVILRYITFRRSLAKVSESNSDGIYIAEGNNIIIDHCSISWASDENIAIADYSKNGTANITVQNSIIANAYGGSSKGSLNGGGVDKITYFRNAFISNSIRNPQFACNSGDCAISDTNIEVINNVVYDYKFAVTHYVSDAGAGSINGNYIKNIGIMPSGRSVSRRFIYMSTAEAIGIYTEGNIDQKRPTDNLDNWESTQGTGGQGEIDVLGNLSYKATSPFSTQIVNDGITLYNAVDIWSNIKSHVGASYPTRDSFDALLVSDIENLTESTDALANTSFPTITNGTALTDIDNDGMPDSWENTKFGNLTKDGKGDTDGDGYTDLEEFLNLVEID